MFSLRYKRYPRLKDGFQFFTSPVSFVEHLYKHILTDGGERTLWGRLFPLSEEPWKTLSRKRAPFLARQEMPIDDVTTNEAAKEAYARVVELIDKGICFSEEKPVYLMIDEELTKPLGGVSHWQTYHFLSPDGFVIRGRQSTIRTIFFPAANGNESRWTVFARGLENMIHCGLRAEKRTRWYNKDENAWVRGVSVKWVVRENFRPSAFSDLYVKRPKSKRLPDERENDLKLIRAYICN